MVLEFHQLLTYFAELPQSHDSRLSRLTTHDSKPATISRTLGLSLETLSSQLAYILCNCKHTQR